MSKYRVMQRSGLKQQNNPIKTHKRTNQPGFALNTKTVMLLNATDTQGTDKPHNKLEIKM